MAKSKTVLDDNLHWYKDAIIYELHIKAFRDGNGDGIGDFQGIMEKLDYLEDLGVTAIWVLPFYPSPLRDDGYDIADYYSINPSYGDIKQFKAFLDEAHNRNLKVITELVINHTSDSHPWFQRARKAPKGSPERDYYVWSDDPTQYKDVRIIFQDYEVSNWTWDAVAQQYYWHRFFHHQPDLNYDSPLVQEEVFKIIDYWCEMGVDGFRLDAVPYLYEREGTNGENLPETHAFLKKLRAHIDEKYPGTVFLAEANMWPEDSASYFGDGDECHMNYHFPVMPRMFMALQMEDRYPITDIFDQTPDIPETCQWAMFLRNHDELTLEMVTDEERDYMYKVYAKDPKAKINLGIRHRLAPLMENNRRKIELMNCLLFSLNGTPVIYYGDEIGMGDNYYLGDRDGVRTPMQWTPDRNAGFSNANPQKLYLPTILDPEYHYESVNVETQRRNPSSLLWFMKRMINMRKRYKAFGRGDMKFINVDNPKVLAFVRTYEEETVLVMVNLSRYSQPAELDLSEYKGFQPVEVFSKNRFPAIKEDSPYFFTLGSYGYQWFVLERVHPEVDEAAPLPRLNVNRWEGLFLKSGLKQLESKVLPNYLSMVSWFNGKERTMLNVEVVKHTPLPFGENTMQLLLLEVHYESGLPETYQIAVTMVTGDAAKRMSDSCPHAILAEVQIGEEEGLLCDALFTTELQQELFNLMVAGNQLSMDSGELVVHGSSNLSEQIQGQEEIKPKLQSTEQDAYIAYGNNYVLKVYRRVDRALNPDVEITRFLCEHANLANIPAYVGTIDWKIDKDFIELAMMQKMVESHGDGWSYMQERLYNYYERILALDQDKLPQFELGGTLVDPIPFDDVPEELKELLGGPITEGTRLLGVRTGEMHLALASDSSKKDFAPEDFSLHYQRSLYSSMQSLVREAFQNHSRTLKMLPDDVKQEAQEVLKNKEDILKLLKRIYAKKLDVVKIRIHGNYHLGQVQFTGKDMAVFDFGGDPSRSYSERRLKRSPLRDVTGMIHSFYYAAYSALLLNDQIRDEDIPKLTPYAELWVHYVSGFFMESYLQTVEGSQFIPKEKEDLNMMIQTYMLEKAIYDLNRELRYRPDWAMVPLRIIKTILSQVTVPKGEAVAGA
ncbi:maltose alpha-D-glucosyltransferase [Telluribacter sp. SYSU D00476]|uniref:maltose alpha-D-glucosyltransferase n=1 Tax=Telluribacter sp. SYSU D00476 TaxID=2811430 RepID=UPI001FF28991|nr:maltose alpha-D-glucosyltransferase [Telluribacter sp. SYSU D00476]